MAHSPAMNGDSEESTTTQALPPLNPGRQVGYTFKDGVVLAIERQEGESKMSHENDVLTSEDAR
jgi:hypothetical protein